MGRSQSAWKCVSIGAAVFFSLPALAQTAPVNTIFAAENSLYGRGYDIGQADGWLDDDLRAAIKRFQSRTKGLRATGNLDPNTLKALGIDDADGTVSRNELSTRRAAISALGLNPDAGNPTARSNKTRVASAPEPKVTAKPTPEPQEKSEPAPATVMATAKPETREAAQVAPQPEPTETTVQPDQPVSTQRTTSPTAKPQPAPVIAKIQWATPAPAEKPDTGSKPTRETESNKTAQAASAKLAPPAPKAADVNADQDARLMTVSAEAPATAETSTAPATAAKPDVSTTEKSKNNARETPSSSGGFFSWLFDMLFGWMV